MPNKKTQPTSVEDLQNQIQLCMMQRQNMEAIFDSLREVNESRVSIHNRYNRQLHLIMSTRVLRDDENIEKGLVAILRDVTELETLRSELQQQECFFNLVGKNHRMQALYQLVQDLSDSDATVLVLGESGTGKEISRHRHPRRQSTVQRLLRQSQLLSALRRLARKRTLRAC